MTDFVTDDILSMRGINVGSLSQRAVFFHGHTEPQPKIVSYKKFPPPSVLAHLLVEEISEPDAMGTLNEICAAAYYSTTGASANLVKWTRLEGYDVKNVVIANSGGIQNCFWGNEEFRSLEEPVSEGQPHSVTFSDEVVEFCYKEHILTHLQIALRLAAHCFSCLSRLDVSIEHDPEVEDEWLVITAHVRGQVDEVLDMYDEYTKQFVDLVPWPARDKIRINYDLI